MNDPCLTCDEGLLSKPLHALGEGGSVVEKVLAGPDRHGATAQDLVAVTETWKKKKTCSINPSYSIQHSLAIFGWKFELKVVL